MQKQQHKKGTISYPKIFLGGLPSNITETDLRAFFGRYGRVTEVVIMYDQEKKKSRGFGFLSFEDEASVERVTCEHYINLNGKQVEIKKAEPRDVAGPPTMIPAGINNRIHNNDMNQWNHPQHQGIPMRPAMNAATANMMQGGYQGGWGTSQQQTFGGYGAGGGGGNGPNPSPLSFPGWGGPPGTGPHPQGPLPPSLHSWNNYAPTTQQTQVFGTNYGGPASAAPGGGTAAAAANWKTWVWAQNSVASSSTGKCCPN